MANIPHWFTDTPALCASDAVDLVSVCVKVPDHAAVVRAALAAGKHILCEWPLGCAAEEADALASEAARAGVHHAIGLQASASSAVRRARELITQGRLGRLRSARSSGCVASIEIGGDRPPDTPFTCEIIGDAGTLCLFGGHMHGFQVGELRLEVDGENVPLDASRATGGLKGAPANVGEVYIMLAKDIRDGTWIVPAFAHAARLTRTIATVACAAESGTRQTVANS